MRYLLLVFLVSGCTSLSLDGEPNVAPGAVQVIDNGIYGTRTTIAPDVTGFDALVSQPSKVFLECRFEAKDDPLSSELGKTECEKEAGRLMLAKQFILISGEGAGAERWLFRFEEKRERAGGGELATPFEKDNKSRMWGTLSRFAPGSTKPYSHVTTEGASQFQRGAWQPSVGKPTSPDSLIVILIKALLMKAAADPKAGADQIDD